jgi:hypothetical protein
MGIVVEMKPIFGFSLILFLVSMKNQPLLFPCERSRMKTWHIAALVIVGLIVAGIAYTMYEKKAKGRWLRAPGPLSKAQMGSEGVPKANSDVPGLGPKVEPERPGGPGVFDSGGGRMYNDDLIDAGWGLY